MKSDHSRFRFRLSPAFGRRSLQALAGALAACIALVAAFAWLGGEPWSTLLRWAERAGLYREAEHELTPVQDAAGNILYWTCTMHPWVRAESPGQCPVCGMDLVPVRAAAAAPARVVSREHAGHAPLPAAAPSEGTERTAETAASAAEFSINPERQQRIGVRFVEVRRQPLTKNIRTVGQVELDERRIAQIHPKVSGWIEETFVNFTMQHVHQGEPLLTIYSPELVAAQEEYLLALRAADQLGKPSNPLPQAADGARSLAEAARARLTLWDVPEAQLAELERMRKAQRTLTLVSPLTGHVVERNAFPGMRVTPDTTLYTIADHTMVWVQVALYESDAGLARAGEQAIMTVPAYPGETFRGRIAYLEPHLESETRTLRARLEFPNPELRLKPGMYADVKLDVPLGARLAVPKNAVLRTGERDLVFVDRGGGRMEVRAVVLGHEVDDLYEVRAGLRAGERVVAAANFLVDAESQVQGAIASWEPPAAGLNAAAPMPAAAAGLRIEMVEPRQPRAGANAVRVLLRDAAGRPVEGAQVELSLFMPPMGSMAAMSAGASLRDLGGGRYGGTVEIPMAASWQTTVTVRKEGRVVGTLRTLLLAR